MSKSSWKASKHCGLPAKPRLVYERTVLHDQEQSLGFRRTAMAMKYQKGTVYPRGTKVKMWYGKYTCTYEIRKERRSASDAISRYARRPIHRSGRQNRCCTASFSKKPPFRPEAPKPFLTIQ
jgi:hypothetical protein